MQNLLKKYWPVILLGSDLIPIFISTGYRKNDYLTGAYLLMYLFLPALGIEMLALAGYYFLQNPFLKQMAFFLFLTIFCSFWIIMLLYVFLTIENNF
jgi:hypothetical protein